MSETPNIKSLPLPPGNKGFPFIGEGLILLTNPNDFIYKFPLERFKQYGEIFSSKFFGQLVIYVQGKEANRFFLTSPKIEINLPPSINILLGGDLSISNQKGYKHKSRRQIIAQAFKPRQLAQYFHHIVEITNVYLDKWEKQKYFTWYPEIQNYTFDVALKFLMGIDNASSSPLKNFYETFELGLFSPFPINLPFTRFGKAMRSRKKILNWLEKITRARIKEVNQNNDALDFLLKAKDEDNNVLSQEELKNQMLTLLFTGYSTLTSSISNLNLTISRYPSLWERLEQEQKQFCDPISKEQLQQMPYLDQVIQEVLRLNPPLVSGFRKVTEDCEFKGYFLPKNTSLFYSILGTHLNETIFSPAKQFNPENFNLNQKKIEPFTYIPFGGGLRECIGKEFAKLEIKILTALLIRNYQWQLIPNQDLSLELLPAPHPRDGLKVQFYRKDHA